MFKVNQKTNEIYLTKGDNAELKVKVFDANGVERQMFEDDVITLTIKKNTDSQAVLSKTANNCVINFVPSDTKSLTVGTYVYDIQLTTFGGNVYTIVPIARFKIGAEITV